MPERDPKRLLSWDELRAQDDCALMHQLVVGNHDALAIIIDRYQRLVMSIALRIVRNATEAEDITQTVFLDIFRKAGKFDASRGTLKVWLLQYAYTRSINRRHYLEQRHYYSDLELEEALTLSPAAEPASASRLAPTETVRLVREAIGTLSERQQKAVDLIYFEGLTLAEASQKMGESLPAVRHNYYRGLMKLREIITSSREGEDAVQSRAGTGKIQLEVANLKARPI